MINTLENKASEASFKELDFFLEKKGGGKWMTPLSSSSEQGVIMKGEMPSCSQSETQPRKRVYPVTGRARLGRSSLRTKAESNLYPLQPSPGTDMFFFMKLR